jgi:hypothetical protein
MTDTHSTPKAGAAGTTRVFSEQTLMARQPINRFWKKVIPEPMSGCWLWTGCVTQAGYGQFHWNGRVSTAHRFAYEYFVGPIPDGLHIDHLCRNPFCVNPRHIEPVTVAENLDRGIQGQIKRRTHCKRGHPMTPDNWYINKGNGSKTCRTCHEAYMRPYLQRYYQEHRDQWAKYSERRRATKRTS